MGEKATQLRKDIDKVMHLLRKDNQSAWVLLSTALSHQLDYSLTLQYPSDMLEVAAELDARLWAGLEQVAGQLRIPRREEGLGVECVVDLPEVPELQGRSYQCWMAAQPVKLGGCGLRSLTETRYPAFLGGLEMSLPFMVDGEHGEQPICPQLGPVVGSMAGQQRWANFLEAGSRTAQEFGQAWNSVSREARNMWTFLGEEPNGPLAAELEEVGGNSVNGSTRCLIVQQSEGLRHKVLTKALASHHDREARPVTAFPNIADDKVAGRFLLATPSSDLSMSATVFKEAISAHLCLASPALREGGWVGKVVGKEGKIIDKFGDSIMCCKEIPGDSWRKRHDLVKQHVVAEAALSGVSIDCEVYGLFSDLLPAALSEEGGELQWGRARQGKVPDFKLLLASPEGPTPRLAELKVISAGKTWYPRGVAGKGTARRAGRLNGEYEATLRKYDVRFHGARPQEEDQPEPPPGPLVTRLRGYGGLCKGALVAGPWGDLSPHFHLLLKHFATSRVEAQSRAQGWEAGPGFLGKVTGEVRRAASVVVVRSQALCLLERLAHLGPGARAAAQRRAATLGLEERRRRERQAYDMAHDRLGLSRVGRAFIPA